MRFIQCLNYFAWMPIKAIIKSYQPLFSISAFICCLVSGSRIPTAKFALKKPFLLPQSKTPASVSKAFNPSSLSSSSSASVSCISPPTPAPVDSSRPATEITAFLIFCVKVVGYKNMLDDRVLFLMLNARVSLKLLYFLCDFFVLGNFSL